MVSSWGATLLSGRTFIARSNSKRLAPATFSMPHIFRTTSATCSPMTVPNVEVLAMPCKSLNCLSRETPVPVCPAPRMVCKVSQKRFTSARSQETHVPKSASEGNFAEQSIIPEIRSSDFQLAVPPTKAAARSECEDKEMHGRIGVGMLMVRAESGMRHTCATHR